MSDLIIKAKHIKFVGIALIVISLIDILSVIIRSIAYEVQFNWILILYVSPIIIGIAFFMTNKSMQDGIFASGMFLTAIMQVMYIISGVSYFTFYHLPMCITALLCCNRNNCYNEIQKSNTTGYYYTSISYSRILIFKDNYSGCDNLFF